MHKSHSNGKWVKSCKICNLYLTHPSLWVEIHNKINKQQESRRSVCQWINEVTVPAINEGLEHNDPKYLVAFSEQNFQAHFSGNAAKRTSGHLQDFHAVKRQLDGVGYDVDKLREIQGIVMSPEDWLLAENYMEELSKELMDYQNLSNMVENLTKLMTDFDEKLKIKIEDGRVIPLAEIDQYQKQVTALFKLTNDLTDLRNKAPIAGKATKMGIEMSVGIFLDTLITVMKDVKILLQGELPNSNLPTEIVDTVLNNLKATIKQSTPNVLSKVMSEYKIKEER